jgi:hypothetical protein
MTAFWISLPFFRWSTFDEIPPSVFLFKIRYVMLRLLLLRLEYGQESGCKSTFRYMFLI